MKQVILHVIGWTLLLGAFGYWAAITPAPSRVTPVKTYNVFPAGHAGPKMQLKGNEIRSNGMCVEVWLNGRIDTIVCGMPVFITETEETTGKPETSVTPAGPAM